VKLGETCSTVHLLSRLARLDRVLGSYSRQCQRAVTRTVERESAWSGLIGSRREGLDYYQRSQVQILPPLLVSGSESTDSEPESIYELDHVST
jgi:hypothetical protein